MIYRMYSISRTNEFSDLSHKICIGFFLSVYRICYKTLELISAYECVYIALEQDVNTVFFFNILLSKTVTTERVRSEQGRPSGQK